MKIYQKIQKLNLPLAIPLLLASLLFVISSCSSAPVVDVATPSTGVTLVTPCPANIDMMTAVGETMVAVTWTPPTATDSNNNPLTPEATHSSGDSFPLGDTKVEYLFTDAAGNIDNTCSFTVTVSQPASTGVTVAACPTAFTAVTAPAEPSITVTWTPPTATDSNNNPLTPEATHRSGDSFPLGDTKVEYLFTDAAGNIDNTCSFTVAVVHPRSTGVTISACPTPITEITAPAETSVAVTWIPPTATDSNNNPLTPEATHSSGDSFPLGDTEVTYTFTDDAGSTPATCSFTVTVSQPVSTDVTISACSTNPIVKDIMGSMKTLPVTWTPPTAVDSNRQDITPVVTYSPNGNGNYSPGADFPIGETTVTVTFTDAATPPNSKTCIFTITVNADTNAPIIADCPEAITAETPVGGQTANAIWTLPTALDRDRNGVMPVASHSPGSFAFPLGETTVTYTFTDTSVDQLTNLCTFTVTVSQPASTGVTVAACPTAFTAVTAPAEPSITVTWTPPTATDSNNNPLTPEATHSSGDSFPLGDTKVEYLFTDAAGNIDNTCSFTVTVVHPRSTGVTISACPTPITEITAPAETSVAVTWIPPTATDSNLNPVAPVITFSRGGALSPGASFPLEETTVLYTFTDVDGSMETCSFTVTVSQPASTGVTISACPNTAITEGASGTTLTAIATWTEPTALDSNLNPLTAVASHTSGGSFPLGDTDVSYRFTDSGGNIETCAFTVTVPPPPITVSNCPVDSTQFASSTTLMASVSWTPPTALDSNGASLTAVASHLSGDSFPVGDTEVFYTFTTTFSDGSHYSDTSCAFIVTVSEPPITILDCPTMPITMLTAPAKTSVIVTWPLITATDPDGVLVTDAAVSHLSGASFDLGNTEVTYTFTGDASFMATCTFTVSVSQPPSTGVTISNCPSDITQLNSVVTWTEPTALDSNDKPVTTLRSHPPGETFDLGSTVISYTFTDTEGNSETCTFTVQINYAFDRLTDTENPSLANPFLIKTSADLRTLASVVNDDTSYTLGGTPTRYRAGNYRLMTSLDLSSGYTHVPIGDCKNDPDRSGLICGDSDDIPFTGTFDGNGQTLTNLSYSNSHVALGLFSITSGAEISNLTLANPSMTNTTTDRYHTTGALVGSSFGTSELSNVRVTGGTIHGYNYVGGLIGTLAGTIADSSTTGRVTGGNQIGGLVGAITNSATITASSTTGAVTGTGLYVGGLVGEITKRATITDSTATGAVSGDRVVGGLLGSFGGTLTSSYATGDVTGTEEVGGLVGLAAIGTPSPIITSSYATGDVTGTGTNALFIGGLVGSLAGTITDSSATGAVRGNDAIGGLVGSLYTSGASITSSYATGTVNGNHAIGGLVGETYGGSITSSYAMGAVGGMTNTGGLVGLQGDSDLYSDNTITASYATGAVTGPASDTGGLVGSQEAGTVTASYWDTTTTRQTSSAGTGPVGVGYTTTELQVLGGAGTIYATWTSLPWVFMAGAYPTLSP